MIRSIHRNVAAFALLLTPLAPWSGPATAQTPTRLLVRVVSHDAKIIGSGVGGARVTVRHAETDEVLASGVQEGSTGDTRGIVVEPTARGATVYDTPGAAHFLATLELEGPTPVVVEAEGPLGTPHALQRARTSLLLLPGVDIVGEGLVIELHGFTVEILSAEAADPGRVDVRARVTMLCGCPIEPGGLWDADRIDVTARLTTSDGVLRSASLDFAGETSVFEGSVEGAAPGPAELTVLAADAARANTGMAATVVTLPAR